MDYPGRYDRIINNAIPEAERRQLIVDWQIASQGELRSLLVQEASGARLSHKLQIGSGPNPLPGWINTDCFPQRTYVQYLDAKEDFPIGSSSISYVFTEHMIEHISFHEAKHMLDECFRVLVPGGKIRIATPDLAKILSVYSTESAEVTEYKTWAAHFNNFPEFPGIECLLVNNFMRAWGHQFIYDQDALTSLLQVAGFRCVQRCPIGQSSDANFYRLEHHGDQIGVAQNEFETMVLEATRK